LIFEDREFHEGAIFAIPGSMTFWAVFAVVFSHVIGG